MNPGSSIPPLWESGLGFTQLPGPICRQGSNSLIIGYYGVFACWGLTKQIGASFQVFRNGWFGQFCSL